MDANQASGNGLGSGLLSLFLGIFTFLLNNAEMAIKVVVGAGSIITAIMACRYYNAAYKEKKQALRKLKEQSRD